MLSVSFIYTNAILKSSMDFILPGIIGHSPAKHLHIDNVKDRVSWFQAKIPSSIIEQDSDKQFDKPCNKYYPAASQSHLYAVDSSILFYQYLLKIHIDCNFSLFYSVLNK